MNEEVMACDREPIHIPGAIQPHGVLLVLREADLTVMQVSANVDELLAMSTADVLDRPLASVIAPACVEEVAAVLAAGAWERNPLLVTARGRSFDGIVHRHDGAAILELEPAAARDAVADLHHPLRIALKGMERARMLAELAGEPAPFLWTPIISASPS